MEKPLVFDVNYNTRSSESESYLWYSVKATKSLLSSLTDSERPTIEFVDSNHAIIRSDGKAFNISLSDANYDVFAMPDQSNNLDYCGTASSRMNVAANRNLVRDATLKFSISQSRNQAPNKPEISVISIDDVPQSLPSVRSSQKAQPNTSKKAFASLSALSIPNSKRLKRENLLPWVVIHSPPSSLSFFQITELLSSISILSVYYIAKSGDLSIYIEFYNEAGAELAALRSGETVEILPLGQVPLIIELVDSESEIAWAKGAGLLLSEKVSLPNSADTIIKSVFPGGDLNISLEYVKAHFLQEFNIISPGMISSSSDKRGLRVLTQLQIPKFNKQNCLRGSAYDLTVQAVSFANPSSAVGLTHHLSASHSQPKSKLFAILNKLESTLYCLMGNQNISASEFEKLYVQELIERMISYFKAVETLLDIRQKSNSRINKTPK